MKLYLAGSEAFLASDTYEFKPDPMSNFFMSYFYTGLTTKALNKMQEYKPKHKGWITIDSGAHTFFGFAGISVVHGDNKKDGEMPDPDIYFAKYVRWLKENYEKFTYFVELDLQSLFGMEMVWRFRRILRDEGLMDKCIMVHHSCNTEKDLDDLMRYSRSGYIGFEGKMGGTFNLDYKKLLKITYHEGMKVHGFALTSQEVIERWPFFSTDSSSWLSAVKFGVLREFKDGRMLKIKASQKHFMRNNTPLHLHPTNRGVDPCLSKLTYNEIAFNKMQEHVTKLWTARGVDYGARFLKPRKFEEFK